MKINSEQEMSSFATDFANSYLKRILDSSDKSPIVLELIGDVGAGKTTFVKSLAHTLGITQEITSPSFTISKSYAMPGGRTLTHYDFYRLTDPGIMSEDLTEKIQNGDLVIIEWASTVKNLLPPSTITINFTKNSDDSRTVTIDNKNASFNDSVVPFSTRFVAPVVTGLLANSLPVGREMSRKVRSESSKTLGLSEPSETQSKLSLYLDTSTSTTILKLNDTIYEWSSGHDLAENLLKFIHDKLLENHSDWQDITSITFMSGPGSFTGLRIGAAVVNTLAHELNIPLYDHHGNQHKIILPEYGREANITAPKK